MRGDRAMAQSEISERTTALTATEAALLGQLTRREGSGYEISRDIERGVGFFWSPARSGIYAVLPRLVEKGYASREDVRQSGRPDKHVYRITQEGEAALQQWLEKAPLEPDTSKNPFLLKLFFGALMQPESVIELVRARKRMAEDALVRLRAIESDIRAEQRESDFSYLTLKWGLEYYEAMIRWADATVSELEDRYEGPG